MLRTFILAAALVTATARSATATILAGGVFEDPQGLAVRTAFAPLPDVSVRLYTDAGAAVSSTRTDAAGHFLFDTARPGTYWVAVDSRSIHPSGGISSAPGIWAEQTYGPAGAMCAQPEGDPRTNFIPDVCVGGRTLAGVDDVTTLATAEHVARIELTEQVTNVDFAFSFNIVTRVDDPAEPAQGTMRQFLANANAIGGPNWMHFVPVAKAPAQEDPIVGTQAHWWAIALSAPLPALTDPATIVDGTAYSFLSPTSRVDMNPGHLGDVTWIVAALHPERPRQEKPELEIHATGEDGFVCEARCTIRALAIHGPSTTIVTRADAMLEQVVVGARPSGVVTEGGVIGVSIERGTTTIQLSHVTGQSTAGVSATSTGRLDAHGLDVQRCGSAAAGAGIVLLSDHSSIVTSSVQENLGAGIVIGSPSDTIRPAANNTIADSVIASSLAGIVLSAGATDNVIARNDIVWNRVGGVVVAPFESQPPMGNRISMNRYDENGGRPIVLDLAAPMNTLWNGERACDRKPTVANAGIVPPTITSARVDGEEPNETLTVSGRACPGQIVEIYQSYVTSQVRSKKEVDLTLIRPEVQPKRETLVIEQDSLRAMPSIGEFNNIGSAVAASDGTFDATFPFRRPKSTTDRTLSTGGVLSEADIRTRAVSAIAIDAQGNTSELSSRRALEGLMTENRTKR
jgi:hypothetical protein